MEFNKGDLVIKLSGGNKMRILEVSEKIANCIWESDGHILKGSFDKNDLTLYEIYKKSVLISENRDNLISKILN